MLPPGLHEFCNFQDAKGMLWSYSGRQTIVYGTVTYSRSRKKTTAPNPTNEGKEKNNHSSWNTFFPLDHWTKALEKDYWAFFSYIESNLKDTDERSHRGHSTVCSVAKYAVPVHINSSDQATYTPVNMVKENAHEMLNWIPRIFGAFIVLHKSTNPCLIR